MKKIHFNFKNSFETFTTYFRHRKETLSFFGTNQYVDWAILLITLSIITLSGVISAGFLFLQVNKGEDAYAISADSSRGELINKDMITHIIEEYDAKEVKFTSLINAEDSYRDPSI